MIWETLLSWFLSKGWHFVLIFVIALVLYFLLKHFTPIILRATLIRKMTQKPHEEIIQRVRTLNSVFLNTGAVVISIIALFTILGEIGIEIGPALAGVGIVGIAVGFGAQSLVKDLLAGLFILLENQYAIGDVVKIADVSGVVEEITLRRTVLRDLDGIVHVIPNGEIKVSSNFTKEWSRVNMNISVGYAEDLDHVIGTINHVGREIAEDADWASKIIKAPQVLRVDKFGDSGIEIKLMGDTMPLAQWEVMGELRLRLKKAFDLEGIEIPWPHVKVYFGDLRSHLSELHACGTRSDMGKKGSNKADKS